MTRLVGIAALAFLASCHQAETGSVTLDAGDDARNATGAKLDADLAAADAAARAPLPQPQPQPSAPAPAASIGTEPDEPASPVTDPDGNDAD